MNLSTSGPLWAGRWGATLRKERILKMMRKGLALGLGMIALAASPLVVAPSHAQPRSYSSKALAAKITKMYPWATPKLIARTMDGKEFSLTILDKGKPVSLEQGVGATLLNLYITELPKQSTYFLTTYSTQGGSALWQYIYTPGTHRLVRYHFISSRTTGIAVWYITPSGIAQAAKTGHWPPAASH